MPDQIGAAEGNGVERCGSVGACSAYCKCVLHTFVQLLTTTHQHLPSASHQNEQTRAIQYKGFLGCSNNLNTENMRSELNLPSISDRTEQTNTVVGVRILRDEREIRPNTDFQNALRQGNFSGPLWPNITVKWINTCQLEGDALTEPRTTHPSLLPRAHQPLDITLTSLPHRKTSVILVYLKLNFCLSQMKWLSW